MPGRNGYAALGGWANGSSSGGSLPADITLNSRVGNQPPEYVASNSIEFLSGFESGTADTFTAYIDAVGGSGSGSSGERSAIYRYGFNGKENDNEVKGEGNQQDYGMRIYDPRIGKFLSVDPLIKDFPWYTPYQFAGNKPSFALDLDGAEELPYWDKAESRSTAEHVGNFLYNSLASVYNGIAGTWNGAVGYVKSSANDGFTGVVNKINEDFKDVKAAVVTDLKNTKASDFTNPENYWKAAEDFTGFLLARKIVTTVSSSKPILTTSNNVSNTAAAAGATVNSELNSIALATKYAKSRPKFRQGTINKVWEAAKDVNGKVFDPNTFEELTWDKFTSRYNQWHMGHKPGMEYNKLVERLRNGEINKQQFLEEYNNPNNYRPEAPAANMSRKFEAPQTGQ